MGSIATYHLAHFVFADPVRHRRRTLKYVSLPSIRAYKLHPNAEVATFTYRGLESNPIFRYNFSI